MADKSKKELQVENRMLRKFSQTQAWALISVSALKWGATAWIAYCFYLSVLALAGKTTIAEIAARFVANIGISQSLAWLLSGGGVAYGIRERKLRQKTVKRLQTRIQDLEKRIDPKRSSSELTPLGETHPRDRD